MTFHRLHEHRDRANQIRDRYSAEVARLTSDHDLTDEARQRRLAETFVRTRDELRGLGERDSQALGLRRHVLERDLLSASGVRGMDSASHAISARDASDRAAQITSPTQAAELLARAEADGDELLARAVARRCVDASAKGSSREAGAWDDVTRVYVDARPSLMPVVEELAEIEAMTERQVFSPFAIPRPYGVAEQYINTAASSSIDAAVEVPA